jgi:hypothetical protein
MDLRTPRGEDRPLFDPPMGRDPSVQARSGAGTGIFPFGVKNESRCPRTNDGTPQTGGPPDLEFVRRDFLNLERDFTHGIFKRLDPRGEFSDHY